MKSKQLSLYLVPVISAFLLVFIVTAAPTTVTRDFEKKGLQTTMGQLYPHEKPQTVAVITPEEVKIEPQPQTTQNASSPANINNPSTSTPVKQASPKPSRSISRSTPSSSLPSKASAIIATGKQFIGVDYLFGGTTPSGFDCSGFVQYVFAKNGISLPRVSRDQFKVGTSVSFNNLKPGDLVFFDLAKDGSVNHVGIYVGNSQFINASSSKGVTVYTFGPYWKATFVGAKRVI